MGPQHVHGKQAQPRLNVPEIMSFLETDDIFPRNEISPMMKFS